MNKTGSKNGIPLLPSPFFRLPSKRASSLVTALLVLVVLSTIVIAFLQSMSIERAVSKSVKNKYRAELAVNAGMQSALSTFSTLVQSNRYWAFGYVTTNGQILPVFVGGASSTNTTISLSTNWLISSPNLNGPLTTTNSTNSADINHVTGNDPTNGWMGSPTNGFRPCRAFWVNILKYPGSLNQPDPSLANYNPVIARYTFWVEDESSKIDLTVAGNNLGSGGGFLRVFDPTSAAIFSNNLANPNQVDLGSIPVFGNGTPLVTDAATTNKSLIISRDSLLGLPLDSKLVERLAETTNGFYRGAFYSTLYSKSSELASTGRRRGNLNAIINTSTNTGIIAGDINDISFLLTGTRPFPNATNEIYPASSYSSESGPMTDFGLRIYPDSVAGSADTEKYLLRIAANIRDYIDTDSTPTHVLSGSPPVVRAPARPAVGWLPGGEPFAIGKEATPYFQEHAWAGYESAFSSTSSNPRIGSVDIDHYLEFFNPYTKDYTAPSGAFIKVYNMPSWSTGSYPAIEPEDFELDVSGVVFPAGKVRVITTATTDPPGLILDASSVIRITPDPVTARTFLNRQTNELISGVRGFQMLARSTSTTDYQTEMIFGNNESFLDYHPFISISHYSKPWNFKGDQVGNRSRFVYSSSMRGNDAASRSGDPRSQLEQLTLAPYGVGGNDTSRFFGNIQGTGTIPGNATLGKAGMSFVSPTTWQDYNPPFADTSATAPATIRDGPMLTIGELGNIYDPHRVNAGSGINYSRGGGRSLRVGQTDPIPAAYGATTRFSPAWKLSAWRLIDIFCARPATETTGPEVMRGKININSVTRDGGVALSSVLRNFTFQSPAEGGNLLGGSQLTASEIAAFTSSIQAFLDTNGPMLERGEISNTSFFTNSSTTIGGQNFSTTMDRGREEIFRRIIELVTTRTAAISIYCIGEAVQQSSNGSIRVLARSRKGTIFDVSPTIAPDPGAIATGISASEIYDIP